MQSEIVGKREGNEVILTAENKPEQTNVKREAALNWQYFDIPSYACSHTMLKKTKKKKNQTLCNMATKGIVHLKLQFHPVTTHFLIHLTIHSMPMHDFLIFLVNYAFKLTCAHTHTHAHAHFSSHILWHVSLAISPP